LYYNTLVVVEKRRERIVISVDLFEDEKVLTQINMFKNTFQSGFLSILYSIGSKPLQIWDKKVS